MSPFLTLRSTWLHLANPILLLFLFCFLEPAPVFSQFPTGQTGYAIQQIAEDYRPVKVNNLGQLVLNADDPMRAAFYSNFFSPLASRNSPAAHRTMQKHSQSAPAEPVENPADAG